MSSSLGTTPYTLALPGGQVSCALYARYSSDNQRVASIEDQIRICRVIAAEKGWVLLEDHIYIDEERTGRTITGRSGFQAMMEMAKRKQGSPFEYILVADVSRLGRDKADLFKTIDILTFRQVNVLFVEDGLDSKEPWFEEAFHSRAQQAARYSKSLSIKVRNGRDGRFLAGYNPGGGCYGYDNVPDEDFTRKGEYGRPAVKGVFQIVNAEQALIVRRIFIAFAGGMSLGRIANMLNSEGVPPSQMARKRDRPSWCKSAIETILRNSRYIGKVVWNTSTQVLSPETGKFERRATPEHLWLHKQMEQLRIVPDELWEEVQAQFVRTTKGFGIKRAGGMSRTERCRKYLFSGLLRCGVCGGNMTITTTNPPVYGCADHRNRHSCDNKKTIRVDVLEQAFLSALGEQLEDETLSEELVHSLLQHLNSARGKAIQDQIDSEAGQHKLEETLRCLRTQRDNLVRAIREIGHSRSLIAELTDVEARTERIELQLETSTTPHAKEVTEEEVRSFLAANRQTFADMLGGEPEAVRHELQKRMSSITLTPSFGPDGHRYTATGDVGLFSRSDDVVQSNQVPLIGPHYTIPIRIDVLVRQKQRPVLLAA
jgi:site-specific DNA recombinase